MENPARHAVGDAVLGAAWRHSDQDWACSGTVWGAVPFALPDAAMFGASVGSGAAAEYEPWRWLGLKLALDLKQQWAARQLGAVIAESQFFAG